MSLMGRLDIAEERISELEGVLIESKKTKKQIKQRLNKTEQNIQDYGTTVKSVTYTHENA